MSAQQINGILLDALAFAGAFGPLVFFHELGHFAIAKMCGVTVEVFSLGFGKRILGFVHKGTDYRVSILPLGGYVKMLGETPDEALTGAPGEFLAKPKWQRFFVLVAGATMNIFLAVVCYTVVFRQGDQRAVYLDQEPIVGGVDDGLPAQKAGVLPGDRIVDIDGRAVGTWEGVGQVELLHPDREVTLGLTRDGKRVEIRLTTTSRSEPITKSKLGLLGVEPRGVVVASNVAADSPARLSGLENGDRIVSVDAVVIEDAATLIRTIRGSADKALSFSIVRDGQPKALTITPRVDPDGIARVGFKPEYESRLIPYTWFQAVPRACKEVVDQADFTFYVLKRLATRKAPASGMAGPLRMAPLLRTAAEGGWDTYVGAIGFISLQLGVINLLPIPVLDGGHIFILLVEGIMRRDLSIKVKEYVTYAGLAFIASLMLFVMLNDITIVARKAPAPASKGGP